MTAEKRLIEKKIERIHMEIEIDQQLGCGFAPNDAYDDQYEEIRSLEERLAELRHYNSVEDMYHDNRYVEAMIAMDAAEELPF